MPVRGFGKAARKKQERGKVIRSPQDEVEHKYRNFSAVILVP